MGALLRWERALWSSGLRLIAGVDEVGVGPLAGPVVAAAVILPQEFRDREVDDSKQVAAAQRERLASRIRTEAVAVGVGIVDVADIDRINIYRAALLAMRRAVESLDVTPERLLVDARTIPDVTIPQEAIVKGDSRSFSIAAASIVAKVTRDTMMRSLDAEYPEYGFGRHMGYATAEHRAALARYGPCPLHRRSFTPVCQPDLPGVK